MHVLFISVGKFVANTYDLLDLRLGTFFLTISYFPFYRFFVDDVGYEPKAVSELRNKLSVLIGTSFTRSRSIPVQFSAIGALLSLLPLTFDKIAATHTGPLSGPCVLQVGQIYEWFAQLSKENQSLARSFFS